MSVIGTTLKQPRVFAHDAVALKDLPGCVWRGVKGLKLLDGGTGFVAGDYATWLSTPITTSNAGNGLGIEVVNVDPDGTIIDEDILIPACTRGNAYNRGDIVSVNSPTAGGSDAVFEVTDLLWEEWDYGCPFTSAYMGSQGVIIEDVTDPDIGKPLYGDADYDASITNLGEENVNGELGQIDQLAGFLKKTIYTYTCGCEEGAGSCECTYETPGPGAALYIGAAMTSITLVMESGSVTTFTNVPAGSFMPVSALTVCAAEPEDAEGVNPKEVILALF